MVRKAVCMYFSGKIKVLSLDSSEFCQCCVWKHAKRFFLSEQGRVRSLCISFGWFLFRARATLHVQLLEVDLLLIDKLSAECCSEDRSVYGNNHESYMIPNLLRQIGLFFDTIFRATQEKVSNIDPTRNQNLKRMKPL